MLNLILNVNNVDIEMDFLLNLWVKYILEIWLSFIIVFGVVIIVFVYGVYRLFKWLNNRFIYV